MEKQKAVKGYKAFNTDWTCRGKQYSCPEKFEEDVEPSLCDKGMHFCKNAADCFNYYKFKKSETKLAEAIAYGKVVEGGNKCCTDKLEIVREIPWNEVLEIVNTGKDCTGIGNSGDCNSGDYNSGNYNSGDYNSGNCNSGNRNSGDYNSGDYNSGNYNSGDCNSGDYNSGNYNSGNYNSGDYNSGNYNSGDWNSGDCNSGDWNKCSFSNGCFNTVSPKIYLFNKPSEWTYQDWLNSEARHILNTMPQRNKLEYISFENMSDEERAAHPEAETTGGYLRKVDNTKGAVKWWKDLPDDKKAIIKSMPNFDSEVFKEITGIEVE